jgi:hypothetical protein
MIILQLSHDLELISLFTDRRKAITEKELSSSRFNFLLSWKTLQSNLSWLHETFSSSATFRERLSKDRSSLTSESESYMFCEDPPLVMRHSPVKLHFLHLSFSSSSELEESSLEKLKAQGSTHSGHDLLELLLLPLVSETLVLLAVTFIAGVILVGAVILVRGVKLLPLGAVGDEVGGVITLKAAPG